MVISYVPLPPSSRRNVPSGPFHWPSHSSVAGSIFVSLEFTALIESEAALRSVQPPRTSVNVRDAANNWYLRFTELVLEMTRNAAAQPRRDKTCENHSATTDRNM